MPRRGDCPICGAWIRTKSRVEDGRVILPPRHRCSERSLRAIDAANERAEDDPCAVADPSNRPYRERLQQGMAWLMGEDEP